MERNPGEELNRTGVETTPRPSASVIVVRDAADGLEVLLVRRSPDARFMAGVWVFPGGAIDAADGTTDAAHRLAAVRELREEAAIEVADPAALVPFSRWITPSAFTIRFDTHFFVVELPAGQRPRIDGAEIVDLRWVTPCGALAEHACGDLHLVFPTVKHFEELAGFTTVEALLAYAHAREHEIVPMQPEVVGAGDMARIVLRPASD